MRTGFTVDARRWAGIFIAGRKRWLFAGQAKADLPATRQFDIKMREQFGIKQRAMFDAMAAVYAIAGA